MNRRLRVLAGCLVMVMGLLAAPPAAAQTVTTTILNPCPYCGIIPNGVVVDPVTNVILVPGGSSNSYIWITGANNSATQNYLPMYATNGAVAANPVTHKFYMSVSMSSSYPRLAVFDTTTGALTLVTVAGTGPLAVNPVTNKIYLASGSSVLVIDGATNTVTTTVTVGTSPQALAVNPLTNKIYVANSGSNNVTVIDGATNATTTVADPSAVYPRALAVNPVTNQIYVANASNNVTVINGATDTVATTVTDATASYPYSIALNPVTNMVYVTNNNSSTVTVINGATNTVAATLTPGTYPRGLAIDSINNKIYVANSGSSNVTVIDGASNTTVTLTVGTGPNAVAVNPVTNKIYVPTNNGNVTVIDGATFGTLTVSAGTNPIGPSVDPVTNRIYVPNASSNTVTVIDGATNSTTTVSVGTNPVAAAANPFTNQIYVANNSSGDVTVIDGATNSTTTVTDPHAVSPNAVAVNPLTNKIYVANWTSTNVTVIDGVTNSTLTVTDSSVTAGPVRDVAVNPVTNTIYVANGNSNTVTVIDGATNSTTTVGVGTNAVAVAVNPVTNRIYVANGNSNNVTVINGATNATTTVSAGTGPNAVAVNPITNQIYVSNFGSNDVTVINGATNATTTVAAGTNPYAVAVNPTTNKIYVANNGSGTATVIDGATNSSFTTSTGISSNAVAVNPVTGKAYVTNWGDNNVAVITEQKVQPIPLQAAITPLAGNTTTSPTPSFDFTATSTFSPFAPTPENLLFQVDTWQGSWLAATNLGSGAFSGTTPALQLGFHIIYAYATDGQEATSTQGSGTVTGSGYLISNITAYGFLVSPPAAPAVSLSATSLSFSSQAVGSTSPSQVLTLTNPSTAALTIAGIVITGPNSGDFSLIDPPLCPSSGGTLAAGAYCDMWVTFTPTATGSRTATLTIADDAPGSPQTVTLSGTGTAGAAPTVTLSPTSLTFRHSITTSCPPKTVTVTNNGPGPLTSLGISTGGVFAQTSTCAAPLAEGASCTLSVTFTPSATGTVTGAVTITDNAADSPQTVALSGTGLPACVLLSSADSARLVRGVDSTEFTISDPAPSCHSSTLSLACTGTGPVSCLFNPQTIPPTGSTLLKLAHLSALAPDALNFRVTGTSGQDTTAVDLTVSLADFSFTPYPTSATVAAGQTASYALTLAPVNGLAGNVQLGCQGAPAGVTCAASPAVVTLNGTLPVQVRVTATTTTRSLGGPGGGWRLPPLGRRTGLLLLAGLMLLVLGWARSRRSVPAGWGAGVPGRVPSGVALAVLGATLLLALVWAGCGGGGFVSSQGVSGTPPGAYALTVTGTFTDASGQASNLTRTTTLTLKVN